jgi:hypothetical protein
MPPIFVMTSAATFCGSRARAASNSAEKTWVAAPGIGLRAHDARASSAEVGLPSLYGGIEIRRYFHLVFEPLLQSFPQVLGIFHREQRDCGFNFCDRAHGRHSSFLSSLCKRVGVAIRSGAQVESCPLDAPQVIVGKFEDRDSPPRKILLVADILIRGDEHIELCLRKLDQVSILEAAPASPLSRSALVSVKQLVQWPRDAFVQKNLHADAVNTASCESPSNPHAASRETEGKHSRNSSIE